MIRKTGQTQVHEFLFEEFSLRKQQASRFRQIHHIVSQILNFSFVCL